MRMSGGVSLSGMSKAFGMPGIRIGWLALKDASSCAVCSSCHDYSTICSSAPSEVCLSPMQRLPHPTSHL